LAMVHRGHARPLSRPPEANDAPTTPRARPATSPGAGARPGARAPLGAGAAAGAGHTAHRRASPGAAALVAATPLRRLSGIGRPARPRRDRAAPATAGGAHRLSGGLRARRTPSGGDGQPA